MGNSRFSGKNLGRNLITKYLSTFNVHYIVDGILNKQSDHKIVIKFVYQILTGYLQK